MLTLDRSKGSYVHKGVYFMHYNGLFDLLARIFLKSKAKEENSLFFRRGESWTERVFSIRKCPRGYKCLLKIV